MGEHDKDRGITLPELLITIVLLGIITAVLSGALITVLRSQDSAPNRIDESRSLQQLVNYLPGDVASARFIEDAPPWVGLCSTTGTPLLNLRWSEEFPSATPMSSTVSYMISDDGRRIERIECGANASNVVIARNFDDVNVETLGASPTRVSFSVTTNGNERSVIGHSRNR